MNKAAHKLKQYDDGELNVILSLVTTKENISKLAVLLNRPEQAIKNVYKPAYEGGAFANDADVQRNKISATERLLRIVAGKKRNTLVEVNSL